MGIDYHGLRFIQLVASHSPLGATATLGRQHIDVSSRQIAAAIGVPTSPEFGPYCEQLLMTCFGASSVDSFDMSDYEGSTFKCDLNSPLVTDRQFDTVIDLGTIEHIFNIAQAFQNAIALCRVGGRIVHVLPANNFPGHGFWQISPELFFALYSEKNGFRDTEVYVAELSRTDIWWRALQPSGGTRAEFSGRARAYIMAYTTKTHAMPNLVVQQSGYEVSWKRGRSALVGFSDFARRERVRKRISRIPFFWRFANSLVPNQSGHADASLYRLSGNPGFKKVLISELMKVYTSNFLSSYRDPMP